MPYLLFLLLIIQMPLFSLDEALITSRDDRPNLYDYNQIRKENQASSRYYSQDNYYYYDNYNPYLPSPSQTRNNNQWNDDNWYYYPNRDR